jgi:phospholipase D1/2
MGNTCKPSSNSNNRFFKRRKHKAASIEEEIDLAIDSSRVTKFLKKQNHDNDLQLLLPRTHFNPIEFKLLKQYFASLCADPDQLYLKEFQCKDLFFSHHLKDETFQFTPEDDFILKAVFKAVNTEGDGLISFSEFAHAMSVAMHGNFYEKAKFSFRIFDVDGDDVLSIQDMQNFVIILKKLGILKFNTIAKDKISRGDEELEQMDVMSRHKNSPASLATNNIITNNLNNISTNIEPTEDLNLDEPPTPFPRGMVRPTTSFASTPLSPDTMFNVRMEGTSSHRVPFNIVDDVPSPLIPSPTCTNTPKTANLVERLFPDEKNNLDNADAPSKLEITPEAIADVSEGTKYNLAQNEEVIQIAVQPPPSDADIDRLIRNLFADKTEISFQDYLLTAAVEKYLVEGLGVYDYIFLPLYNPIQEFLSSESPYEKTGPLKYKGKPYHVEIRGGIIYHYDTERKSCKKMINIEKLSKIRFQKKTVFEVKKGRNWRRYESVSDESVQNWVFCLLLFMISRKDNRFNSFAPLRRNSAVRHLVDGKETFGAIAHALLNAKEQIFIAGWCISPFIYLKRDRDLTNPNQYRLDNILYKMANKGCQIYIIMWHETTIAGMNLSSAKIQKMLNAMHPNIHCIMHPRGVPYQWTHHQKCVIVDQVVAFCGGLDLAWGRYDTSSHPITDNCYYQMTYPGNDYYNGTVSGFVRIALKIDGFRDGLDRDRHPRMPWHDVHCVAIGKLAKDFASNFISRWNHHNGLSIEKVQVMARGSGAEDEFVTYPSVLELTPYDAEKASKAHLYLPSNLTPYHVRAQVLRSISTWSGSMRTEQSIHAAYIETIKRSQFYIYIENQYFCSRTPKSLEIENLVAQAIIERISRAILNEEIFRVYIVLPMHPDGDPFDSSIQQVIKWQRRTIEGIFETLKTNFPEANVENYLAFFCLSNYGFLQNMAHFNQVYIHSKLMLVDDRVTIIGSANINDRSLVGSHDSEIAVIVEDTDSSQTMMNNKLRRVGKFGKSLRKRLWREHLGLEVHQHGAEEVEKKEVKQSNSNVNRLSGSHQAKHNRGVHLGDTNLAQRIWNQPISIAIKDPISDYTFNHIWKKRSRDNTKIYESVFNHYPSEKFPTVSDWKKAVDAFNDQVDNLAYNERIELHQRHQKVLKGIKGLVVDYPLNWLKKDAHNKEIRLQVLSDNIFY